MVGFHPINRTLTVGTFLFIASLIVLIIGSVFHSNGTILAYAFIYGGLAFLISLILLGVGTLLAARSGKLQKRASDIFHNTGKKQN